MPLLALPAVFMRGGTSRAVMFHARDLPERVAWDPIFLAAMGSPDPNGRQLDGMGGGISSLSKICILAASDRADADIDYTFAQVQIREAAVDYRANCGNMSSAVGPFAVDEGLVQTTGDTAVVRIFNTNTGKIIRSTFPLRNGRAAMDGDLAIPGVAGTGAPIRLDFLSPGGSLTGRLLPTGNVRDWLELPGLGSIEVSIVDAAKPCVLLRARDLGLSGTELPDWLDANPALLGRLEAIRRAAALAIGLAATPEQAAASRATPGIGFVAPPGPGDHAGGRHHPAPSGRPDRSVHLQRTAAPRPAGDLGAVHRRRRSDQRHRGGRGAASRPRRIAARRHAVRHPDRRRRRDARFDRRLDRPWRCVLSHRAAPVRRPYLRPALRSIHGRANRSPAFRIRPVQNNAITELCVGAIAGKTDLSRCGFVDIGHAVLTP